MELVENQKEKEPKLKEIDVKKDGKLELITEKEVMEGQPLYEECWKLIRNWKKPWYFNRLYFQAFKTTNVSGKIVNIAIQWIFDDVGITLNIADNTIHAETFLRETAEQLLDENRVKDYTEEPPVDIDGFIKFVKDANDAKGFLSAQELFELVYKHLNDEGKMNTSVIVHQRYISFPEFKAIIKNRKQRLREIVVNNQYAVHGDATRENNFRIDLEWKKVDKNTVMGREVFAE